MPVGREGNTESGIDERCGVIGTCGRCWRFLLVNGFIAAAALVASALVTASLASALDQGAMIEWPYVGAGQAHTKYASVEDITAANVGELEIVWHWEPNERPLEEYGTRPGPFQATPIMVDNVLYLSTMYMRVAALDAETGAELWTFDPTGSTRVAQRVRGRAASSTGASPGGAMGKARASSSTAATGSTRSMPRPASWTRASARAGASC